MFLNYVESGLRIIPVPGRCVLGVEENVAKHVTIPGGGGERSRVNDAREG